jgi:hypothetical protein
MNKTILIFIVILFSCSHNRENIEFRMVKKLELNELEVGFVHGRYNAAFNDTNRINSDFITSKFKIKLNNDFTFRIENEDKSIDEGTYHFSTDSLALRKNNNEWLTFLIGEQTDTKLKLSAKRVMFYHIENDSIQFFTGDNVTMCLIKLTSNYYLLPFSNYF